MTHIQNYPLYCLEIWGTDYNKIKEACLSAETLGYDGFYYGESLAEIDLDCWTILANLSAITNRIKLGPVITYLFPHYRNISLLAKQALTLQQISCGRLEFRTGAGATIRWASQWWYPYGIDYPSNGERVSLLEESVQVLHMLWSKPYVTFNGRFFKLKEASLQKIIDQKYAIPITIAAKQNKTMRIAAKYADVWETSYLTPEQFVTLNEKFENILDRVSIENTKKRIIKSIELDVIVANDDSDLDYKKKIFAMERGPGVAHQTLKHGLVGTPAIIRERINEYVNAGIDQFFLAFQDPLDIKALELFAKAIEK